MCSRWFGQAVLAFGIGILMGSILPFCILVPVLGLAAVGLGLWIGKGR